MNYRIFATSRSGHHAFINWLAKQLGGSTKHHNNCAGDWENQQLKANKNKIVKYGKKPYVNNIYSIECFNLNDYKKYEFDKWNDDFVDILFLRDFYNWLASTYKINDKRINKQWVSLRGEKQDSLLSVWNQYAKEFIGITNKIPIKYSISYNDWFLSKEYREKISNDLKIKFTDRGLKEVSDFCNGSSYDKKTIKDGRKLDVLNRWKKHKNDKKYIEFVNMNEENIELNNRIFNIQVKL